MTRRDERRVDAAAAWSRRGVARAGRGWGWRAWAWAVALALVAMISGGLLLGASGSQAQDRAGGAKAVAASTPGAGSAPAASPRPPRVSSIQAQGDARATIVSIRLDREARHRVFALTQPSPRLVVDMERVQWAVGGGQGNALPGRGLVAGFRYAHKNARESRLVLDLTGPVRIASQEVVAGLGGRTLRLRLLPAGDAEMARTAPVPAPAVKTAATGVAAGPVRPGGRARKFTVVIDPGHGGKDPGATGHSGKLYEKEVVLASALLLRDMLVRDGRFDVVMTRQTDVFLTLERRIVIARDARADLFISLHADAAPPEARVNGATVYTLSEEGGERARRLLNTDNWTIAPSNATRDTAVVSILKDLTQRDTKNQSSIFATTLIERLRPVSPLTGSSHRRAGFFVLLSPTVPAVLLELGFMTDAEDEARLGDPAERRRMMRATAQAIGEYFSRPEVVARRGEMR
jgi:N-acetylmuramoyl-L-alanine amidase